MHTQTTLDLPARDIAPTRLPSRGEPPPFSDIEGQVALCRVNELLGLAQQCRDAAYAQIMEDPQIAHETEQTVQLALRTQQEVQQMTSASRRPNSHDLNQKIATLTSAVNHTADDVHQLDGGSSVSHVAKRNAYYTGTQPKKKSAEPAAAPRRRSRRGRHDHDDDDDDDDLRRSTRRSSVARHAEQRETVRTVTEQVTRAQNVALSALGLSPVVAPAEVATAALTGAAAAFSSNAATIATSLIPGIGMPMTLAANFGLPGVPSFFSHAAAAPVRAGSSILSTAITMGGAARDTAADHVARMTRLGRELQPLLGQMQGFKNIFDTDHDGRAELHEICARMRQFNITHIHNVDGVAGISLADVRHTWNMRNQPHRH